MNFPHTISEPPARRRNRATRACEECRSRKVKCNGQEPCEACWLHRVRCYYRSRPDKKKSAVRIPQRNGLNKPNLPEDEIKPNYSPSEYRQQLELRAGIGVSNSQTGSFQFYGPSSHFCFIQRIYQRMKRQTHGSLLDQQKTAVPDGLEQWGLERFMFAAGSDNLNSSGRLGEAFLSREIGQMFIVAYFNVIHPHMPILSRNTVDQAWEQMWEPPTIRCDIKGKDILYMVLALGARTIHRSGTSHAECLDYQYGKDEIIRMRNGITQACRDDAI